MNELNPSLMISNHFQTEKWPISRVVYLLYDVVP